MRTCGNCHVCCYETLIESIGKPEGKLCKHYKNGCSVYDNKPKQCTSYKCSWLEGHGDKKDRPDKSGLIVDIKPIDNNYYICAREVRENADRHILETMKDIDYPILVRLYKSENTTGDLVILNDRIKPRAKALMGEQVEPDTYRLRIG